MRRRTQSITRALFFLLLASVGPSLGCVDLTPPWEKPGHGADARGDVADVGGGGSQEDADSGYPIVPDVDDAPPIPPELPVDAEQPPPQPNDGGPVDTPPDTSDDGPLDTSRDTSAGKADANADATPQPVDSSNDQPAPDSRPAGDDVPPKEDRNPDLKVLVPDSSLADTPLDAPSPSLDAGREVPAISGLLAAYPCEGANGAVLPDTSGHSKNATLANGAGGSTPVGFSFGTGRVGNALTLSSSNQAYVSLPRGMLSQLSQVTIATWVKLNSSAAFQRIFDFGVDTNTFMYLVNSASSGGGNVRFRITSLPLNKNQVLEGAVAVPVGSWTHVALTLGDNGVSIYLNGAQVAQQAPAVLRPSDLGDTGNNFIGRSPFAADPYLDGQIDEFRIYDRVLSPAEIGELANGG